jgi:hypothetical protein
MSDHGDQPNSDPKHMREAQAEFYRGLQRAVGRELETLYEAPEELPQQLQILVLQLEKSDEQET